MEDPAFFQEQLKLLVEQGIESCRKVVDEKVFSDSRNADFATLRFASMNVILQACRDVILWDAVAADIIDIENARHKLEAHIELSRRLPASYEEPLQSLIGLTSVAWRYAVQDLHLALVSSAEFIQFFELIPGENGLYADLHPKKSTEDQWPQILHLLIDLNDLRKTKMMGPLNMLDEMERVMTSDKTQGAMIGAGMAKGISKLAALAQINDALFEHQPTIQCRRDSETIIHESVARLKPIDELQDIFKVMPLPRYADPMLSVTYPASKKRTFQHIEQMRLAEQKLDTFWEHVNKEFVAATGKTLRQWMGSRLTARELQRTQPWQPTEQEQQLKKLVDQTSHEPTPFNTNPTPEKFNKLPTEPRKKQKTRGESESNRASSTTEIDSAIPQKSELTIQTFSLPSRALKTMRAFYPTSTEDRKAKAVVWKDFLHAMYSLGFAIQKRHGSEWYFEPSWKQNAPITIHEPHPKHEMGFNKMRFEANRMARKYGWSSDSFQAA